MEEKFIKIINPPDCGIRINYDYTNHIGVLVEKIFDGAINNHAVGYQVSTEKNIDCNIFKDGVNKTLLFDNYNSSLSTYFNNSDKLGNIEKRFINYLLFSDNKLVVLKGYRGTGKSELIRYVSKFIVENRCHNNCNSYKICKSKKVIHIFIDFKEDEISEENTGADFERKLYPKLESALIDLFNNDEIISSFIEYAIKNRMENFATIDVALVYSIKNWNKISFDKKFRYILNWVRQDESKLDMLYELLKYIKTKYNQSPNCFCLIIDNIDQLRIEQQHVIVDIVNKISNKLNIKVIIPVRLTTCNNIKGNAGGNFWGCGHMGFPPIDLCLLRIKHYLENQTNDYYKADLIPRHYRKAFDQRLRHVYNKLTISPQKGKCEFERLYRTFESTAGVSIRKCLRLFRRLFLNYTIDWNDPNPKEDLLIRSLYSYKYTNGRMNPKEDNRIHNIFRTDNGALTLSLIRILHTVWENERNSDKIRVNELRKTLSLYYPIDDNNFDSLFQILWQQGKRVITLVDVGTHEMSKIGDAMIEITKAGIGHLQYLSKDLQYLQNCFEVIDMNNTNINFSKEDVDIFRNTNTHDQIKQNLNESLNDFSNDTYKNSIPIEIDYNNFGSRMAFLRKMLRILYMQDVIETMHYLRKYNAQNERIQKVSIINNLVSVPIIIGVTNSVFNIAKNNELLESEKDDWKDFVMLLSLWNECLFPKSNYNKDLSNLISRLEFRK